MTKLRTVARLSEILQHIRSRGIGRIFVACTHGLFTGKAIERLKQQTDIEEIVTTNTVPIPAEKLLPNMTIISLAPLIAETIRRNHNGESVSSLFDTI